MILIHFVCEYCGAKWKEFVSQGSSMPDCPKCRLSKDVMALEMTDEDRNPFGYRK